MKNLRLFACFSLFIFHFSFSYGQSWLWAKASHGSFKLNDYGAPVATDKNGNAYITGDDQAPVIFGTDTLAGGNDNAYLVKYNSAGSVLWANNIVDSTGFVASCSIATDVSSNIYIAGYYSDNAHLGTFTLSDNRNDQSNAFIAKYNTSGNVLWVEQSTFTSGSRTSQGSARSVAIDRSGNAFITGTFDDTLFFGGHRLIAPYAGISGISSNTFLVKYDSSGNVIWAAQSNVLTATSRADGNSVAVDKMGNSYITGYVIDSVYFGPTLIIGSSPHPTTFIVKYSPTGSVIWAKQCVNGATYVYPSSLITDPENNIYLAGTFEGTLQFGSQVLNSPSGFSLFMTKCDTSGNFIWAKPILPGWRATPSLASDKYNHLYLAATNDSIYDTTKISTSSILMRLDTAGIVVCSSRLRNLGTNRGNGVASDSTGTYIYTASSFEDDTIFFSSDTLVSQGGGDNAFLARWVNCAENAGINELKGESEKVKVYPNPFINSTTIALINEGNHYLELDDLTGRKLRWIEFTGTQYELHAQGLAKGIYFIRAYDSDMNVIGTSKMVVQ